MQDPPALAESVLGIGVEGIFARLAQSSGASKGTVATGLSLRTSIAASTADQWRPRRKQWNRTRPSAATLDGIVAELPVRAPDSNDLVEWLGSIKARTADMERWAANDYYHPDMRGRTSIKVVMDALWKADPAVREQCGRWSGISCNADQDPYSALPAMEIAGQVQDVREGTGAIIAYQHMMYGSGRDDREGKEGWSQLLRSYCELDTLSMVLIFDHLRRISGLACG